MFLNRITDNKNSPPNFRKSVSKLVGKILIIIMLLTGFNTEATFAEEEDRISKQFTMYIGKVSILAVCRIKAS